MFCYIFINFFNNDIIVSENWLRILREFYENNNYALISPSMREGGLDYDLEEYISYFSSKLKNRVFVDEFRGVCLFAKRDIFDKIGFFDPFLSAYLDDLDFFVFVGFSAGTSRSGLLDNSSSALSVWPVSK